MRDIGISFCNETLRARATGSLWWQSERLLCVSDMHLGKTERTARKGGALIPPFETHETLARLGDEIAELSPKTVICLGDSFNDLKALDDIHDADYQRLTSLIAGREWIWIEGDHDAGPVGIGGAHVREFTRNTITFRHIANATQTGEISGYYHPKTQATRNDTSATSPCFLYDSDRIILPAFGNNSDKISRDQDALSKLMNKDAQAVVTGSNAHSVPMTF